MRASGILLATVALTAHLSAQPLEGKKVELSISGAYQSSSYESGSSSGSSSGVFYVSPRVGVFVFEGLEMEPEVSLLFGSGGAAYILNGNLSYNFVVRKRDMAFLLAGYGYSNSLPFLTGIPGGYFGSKTDFGVLNLGGGLKVLVAENVAMRVEFRHQRYTGSQKYDVFPSVYPSYVPFTATIIYIVNSVSFGFSIFV